MAFGCNIGHAILKQMHFETCFQKVFASVSYAEFGRYSADIHLGCVKKFKDFSHSLLRGVDAFITGILLAVSVAPLVECQFFTDIRNEVFVDSKW